LAKKVYNFHLFLKAFFILANPLYPRAPQSSVLQRDKHQNGAACRALSLEEAIRTSYRKQGSSLHGVS